MEVPYEKLERYLDAPDLPDAIERLDVTERGNQAFIEAVPADDSVGKYTPTATLRATITDARVYEYEGTRTRTEPSTPDDTTPPSTVETFANFKGRLGTVIKNTALREPMFVVLHDIARLADRGELTAVVARDGELEAVSVRDGEEVPAAVEIAEEEPRPSPGDVSDWQNGRP
ncbi:MAG: hypothetical protein ABEH47_06805 [Haloferacaceae archaeon]